MKKRIRLLTGLLAGVLLMLGLAVSSASSASAVTVGPQQFLGFSSNPTATVNPVIANGSVIKALGSDLVVNDTTDVFRFPRGSLLVRHIPAVQRDNLDPITCLGSHSERGVWVIPNGTRAYLGARGRGTYTARVVFVAAQSPITGRCLPNRPPLFFSLNINANGTLRLP
jgi:hypothetical protein